MGAVICFDSQNMTALKNIQTWIKDFREKARDGAPILLVATKQDLRLNQTSKSKRSCQNVKSATRDNANAKKQRTSSEIVANLLLPDSST